MWEAIEKILTDKNSWLLLCFVFVVIVIFIHEVRNGFFSFSSNSLRIGNGEKERNIIRQQVEWAHIYIMSLESKITPATNQYNGYFTKFILERVYDEVVDWVTFNHLNLNSAYIEIKQEKICALVYSLHVKPEFQTKEFKQRMNNWTREIIEGLVRIRQIYK